MSVKQLVQKAIVAVIMSVVRSIAKYTGFSLSHEKSSILTKDNEQNALRKRLSQTSGYSVNLKWIEVRNIYARNGMMSDFVIIDLHSQKKAITKYTTGMAKCEILEWMCCYGTVEKFDFGHGNTHYHFKSTVGLGHYFYFDKYDKLVIRW